MMYCCAMLIHASLRSANAAKVPPTSRVATAAGAHNRLPSFFARPASRVVTNLAIFWSAFILTRPLGATVGDFLDKPHANGGLELSRLYASAILAAFIVVFIMLVPQKAGQHPGAETV
jgi:hypothetical protein